MIPQIEPWIDSEELKEITEVIKSTWITEGKKTKEFEEELKRLIGTKYVSAYMNGTVTLFTALKLINIKRGDEILVPSLTFAASINAILFAGGKPVLVDVDKTMNINPELIKEKITKKTKAIMPVHLYGQSADMDKIMKIAKENSLFVIEDAAQGIGVFFNNRHVGSFGDMGSFSFYGNKTITTGEGGALVTNRDIFGRGIKMFKNHGRMEKGFIHEKIGFNFNFTDMQAAIGIAQMRKLKEIIKRKEKIRNTYLIELSNINEIKFPYIDPRCKPVHWFTTILVPDAKKLEEKLKRKDIQTRRIFYPIHMQPCYKKIFRGHFPMAEKFYQQGLSLPSSAILKKEQLLEICRAVKEIYKKDNLDKKDYG